MQYSTVITCFSMKKNPKVALLLSELQTARSGTSLVPALVSHLLNRQVRWTCDDATIVPATEFGAIGISGRGVVLSDFRLPPARTAFVVDAANVIWFANLKDQSSNGFVLYCTVLYILYCMYRILGTEFTSKMETFAFIECSSTLYSYVQYICSIIYSMYSYILVLF